MYLRARKMNRIRTDWNIWDILCHGLSNVRIFDTDVKLEIRDKFCKNGVAHDTINDEINEG